MSVRPDEWCEAYARAWRARDVEAVVALFTEDAVYRSHPFRPPDLGHAGVREYTARAFGSEAEIEPRFGVPVVSGRTAVVEYWATMREEGEEVTLAGCDMLRFDDDGRCAELRDYWHLEPGRREPPDAWGE